MLADISSAISVLFDNHTLRHRLLPPAMPRVVGSSVFLHSKRAQYRRNSLNHVGSPTKIDFDCGAKIFGENSVGSTKK